MVTLEQVKEVPFSVRAKETHSYLRLVPYNDQAKTWFNILVDFESRTNYALHHHYCISFVKCPFFLNFDSLVAHFDWCCRYLYFNFEHSVLRVEIFARLERLNLDKNKLDYLIQLLDQFPGAYQYSMHDADYIQQWALLKRSKFQTCADFRQMVERDKQQRSLLADHLKSLLNKVTLPVEQYLPVPAQPVILSQPAEKSKTTIAFVKREREASLYNFLKLNDNFTPATCRQVIAILYDILEPCFRQPYSRETFSDMFYNENSPELELNKTSTWDNQCFMLLFQELKNTKVLTVSWQVVERKVKVFKSTGSLFSGFSELSAGKISARKRNQVRKKLEPLFPLINKDLQASNRK